MAYKTLQNPDQFGMGNDYLQDESYVVKTAKDKNGVEKTTWRDGIYTKLAYDIKDPEGYNKRTVNTPQSGWNPGDFKGVETLSGDTDGSALFSPDYATAVSFGQPFSATSAVSEKVFEAPTDAYYKVEDIEKVPQGIDVASFRPVASKEDVDKTV
jgi:hypothetical protein